MDVYVEREKECFMGKSLTRFTVHIPSYGGLKYNVEQERVRHETSSAPFFWNSPETFAQLRERGQKVEVPDDLVQKMAQEHAEHVAPAFNVNRRKLAELQKIAEVNTWEPKEQHENFGEKIGDLIFGMAAVHVLIGISSAMHHAAGDYSLQVEGFYALVDEFHTLVERGYQKPVCT